MPRTEGPDGRERSPWVGVGDGLGKAIDLVAATAIWAGIGYLIDRWLGTWPIVFAIGAVAGNFTGIYVLYRRSIEESGDRARSAGAGVSRGWGRKVPAPGEAGMAMRAGEDDEG